MVSPTAGGSASESPLLSATTAAVTMSFLLHNKLSFLLAASHYHHLLRFSISTATKSKPSPAAGQFSIVPYLMSTVGLSKPRALRASKSLTRLRSPHRPDAVLRFLRHTAGLSLPHIRTLVSWYPALLLSSVDRTLSPRLLALRSDGFSGPLLLTLIRSNPLLFTISLTSALPRLRFWRHFFRHHLPDLTRAVKRNRSLVNYDLHTKIYPNLALLRSHGLSDTDIAHIMTRVNGFVLRSPASIEFLIARVSHLGIPPESGVFKQGLSVVAMLKKSTLDKKMELFKSLGWSETQVLTAFRRCPTVLGLSEDSLQSKIGFLVNTAGCEPATIARRTEILAYSLEKRLVPRHCVLQVLKSKELGRKATDLFSVMNLSEERFVDKFIRRFEKEVPELKELYTSACAGRFPVSCPSLEQKKKTIALCQ